MCLSKRVCAMLMGGWVGRWVAGTQISYVGEQKMCAGCKMDDGEGVSRQGSWDCSKQRWIEVPSTETNIPLQQAQDSASLCTHSPHPTRHLSLLHRIHNPFACNLSQAERIQQFLGALELPFTSVGSVCCCICGERTSGGARAETRAGGGRTSGWRAVCDTLRSTATVPLCLLRAWQALS